MTNTISRLILIVTFSFVWGHLLDAPAQSADSLLTPEKEQDLFNGLDLSGDNFKPIQKAVAQKDYVTARHLLADYFRQRTCVPWKFDPHHPDRTTPFNKEIADGAVKGHLKGGQIPLFADFPGNKVDWLYNETFHHPGAARNIGWEGQLTRMDFWTEMAAAYRATGDETYAKAWVQQMRSFIQQCPPPLDAGGKPSIPGPNPPILVPPLLPGQPPTGWTPIDVGCRLGGAWSDAFFSFVDSPSVSDDDLLLFVYGSLLHGEWLSTHHGPGNGWMFERTGLYTLAASFPEFKQSAQWRNQAVTGQQDQTAIQFLPDGFENEFSTGYHNACIDSIVGIPTVARIVGRMNEIPPEYIKPLEKAYECNMYLMAPDYQMPKFNDSWLVHIPGLMKVSLPLFPQRQDFLWVASERQQGHPPAQTSYAFNYAGFYVMRSGWDLNANYLVFRDGPFVFSHGHQDKLSVVMWAYGREILFNSGGGPYDASKWRQYSIDTYSKNTVLVDGLPQRRPRNMATSDVPKIDSRWETTPDHDFAAGIYDEAYGDKHPATHYRRVLFVKPDLMIIADTMTPNDGASHSYQARWNLLTTSTKEIDSTHEVLTTDPNVANLDIVPLNPKGLDVRTACGQSQPELAGWNVLHNTVGQPAKATTVMQTRQGTGVQTFLTLLVPMQPGTTNSVQSVTETGPGTAQVTFNDGRKLVVSADPNSAGGIEATETLANGSPGRHVQAGVPR